MLIDAAAARIMQHLDAGRPAAAVEACRVLLRLDPGHAETNHILGLAYLRLGRADDAVAALGRAVARQPASPIYLTNLGVAQQAAGQAGAAATSYRAALALAPDSAQIHANLGVVLLALGQVAAAAAAQRQALLLAPSMPEAHYNLGLALAAGDDPEAALSSFAEALRLRPDYAPAATSLSATLLALGRPGEARAAAERAVALAPETAAAHHALANVLAEAGELEAAATAYEAALHRQPDPAAFRNLSQVLRDLGRYPASATAARSAIALAPDDARNHAGLGRTARLQFDRATALASLARAHELDPDDPLTAISLGEAWSEAGQHERGLALMRQTVDRHPELIDLRQPYLFALNYLGEMPVTQMVAEARRYGELLAASIPRRAAHDNTRDPDRQLRVGLLSGDFIMHPVARLLASVLPELDPASISLFAYSANPARDSFTARFEMLIPNWREVARLDDAELAERIESDSIDILIDLSGLSAFNRLPALARKPAPIIVTWLGYFATTGLPAIDYVLASQWAIPPGEEDQWVEAPWRLPETYLCFTPPEADVPITPPPALHNGFVTFGSANHLNKLSDPTLAAWARVLAAVPDSRLLLRTHALSDEGIAAETRQRFAAAGVAATRLVLQPAVDRYADHLARYADVDIALDPFPYNGGMTTIEALWMGVPVLVRRGDRYVSHMGENILHNLGLPDWIAADDADYADRAASFAADLSSLARLRQELRPRLIASPLMDAPRFARYLEAALRQMWRLWCAER